MRFQFKGYVVVLTTAWMVLTVVSCWIMQEGNFLRSLAECMDCESVTLKEKKYLCRNLNKSQRVC